MTEAAHPPAAARLSTLLWLLVAGLALASHTLATPAQALPFDPVPSAFQNWLNGRRNWPGGAQLRFENLGRCYGRSPGGSPYASALFQCLEGTVRIQAAGGSRTCTLTQVIWLAASDQVRYRTGSCR